MPEMTHKEWVASLSIPELIAEGYCVKCRYADGGDTGPCEFCHECALCCTCGTFDSHIDGIKIPE